MKCALGQRNVGSNPRFSVQLYDLEFPETHFPRMKAEAILCDEAGMRVSRNAEQEEHMNASPSCTT